MGSSAHQDVIDAFHRHYYDLQEQTRENNSWLGVKTWKCPLELWVYQELLYRVRPDLVVETGTYKGGSAYFMAGVFDLIGRGRVLTIDVDEDGDRPEHARIEYIRGSSVDATVLARVRQEAARSDTVLVILDSDHHRDHVLAELREYSGIVTPGSYLIVEDTNINGHPVRPEYGPGPREAVEIFLADTSDFIPDAACEKFLLTWNSGGYLRRIPDSERLADRGGTASP
jgi:cephalosporin hydroxylase